MLPCRRFADVLAGRLRTAWGRCGSLLLHRSGLPHGRFRVKWSGSSAHQKAPVAVSVSKVWSSHSMTWLVPHQDQTHHPVAARAAAAHIPRSADGAQEVETILSLRLFKPVLCSVPIAWIRQDRLGPGDWGDCVGVLLSALRWKTITAPSVTAPLVEYFLDATRSYAKGQRNDRGLAHLTAALLWTRSS